MRPAVTFMVAAAGTAGALAGFGSARTAAPPSQPLKAMPAARHAPQSPGGSLVATARRPLLVYARASGTHPERRLPARAADGQPLTLLTAGGPRSGWLEVYLPLRPNGSRGWVRAASVTLSRDPYRLTIRRRAHRLILRWLGRPVLSAPVAIGAPPTPTPAGRFFLTELLRQPDPGGSYGPWAYALSGFSPALTRFHGGHGEIGIHGTNRPALIGRDVSHGCIRVANRVIVRLARLLPLGTPVDIS